MNCCSVVNILYHVEYKRNVEKILQNGLNPGEVRSRSRNAVFFTSEHQLSDVDKTVTTHGAPRTRSCSKVLDRDGNIPFGRKCSISCISVLTKSAEGTRQRSQTDVDHVGRNSEQADNSRETKVLSRVGAPYRLKRLASIRSNDFTRAIPSTNEGR